MLDLEPGYFRVLPHSPSLQLTRSTAYPYDPDSDESKEGLRRWIDNVARVIPDEEHRLVFQCQVGQSLVGELKRKEPNFIYVFGPGGVGKTKIVELLGDVFGTYTATVSTEHLRRTNGHQAHTSSLVNMAGARFAIADEVRRGAMDIDKLKKLTGEAVLRAQTGMGKDFIDFVPTATLWLTSNWPLDFGGETEGMDRRYRPIPSGDLPFTKEERTRMLMAGGVDKYFLADGLGSGILTWAVQGWKIWANGEMPEPESLEILRRSHISGDEPLNGWAEYAGVAAVIP